MLEEYKVRGKIWGHYGAFASGLLLNPLLAIVLALVTLSDTVLLWGRCVCTWYGARVGELLHEVGAWVVERLLPALEVSICTGE